MSGPRAPDPSRRRIGRHVGTGTALGARGPGDGRGGREPVLDPARFLPGPAGLDAGPSPLARPLILIVACLFGVLLAWGALAEVDRVVLASGKVEPAGRVKLVNHPRGGRVVSLRIAEGERVAAGQLLLVFDAERSGASRDGLRDRLDAALLETARLTAEIDGGSLRPPPGLAAVRPDRVTAAAALLDARRAAFAGGRTALRRAVERQRGEARALGARVKRLAADARFVGEQADAMRVLAGKGLYPRLKLLEVERRAAEAEGAGAEAAAEREAALSAAAEAESRLAAFERDGRADRLADLASVRAEADRLAVELRGQASLVAETELRAPVAGAVQDLRVTAAGQSVGAFEPILRLVPEDGGLAIAARVANADIGEVTLGQEAVVKVRAFDYTRHGTLKGRVTRIDPDATPEPEGPPAFGVRVETDGTRLGPADGGRAVSPGMAVEVELMAGARTPLSYLTERLFRLGDRAFREG